MKKTPKQKVQELEGQLQDEKVKMHILNLELELKSLKDEFEYNYNINERHRLIESFTDATIYLKAELNKWREGNPEQVAANQPIEANTIK